MALIDSLLAFALTLAALATVVTLLLEVFIRWLGVKRRGQVELIGRLLCDSLGDRLSDKQARWQAVKAILQNPFSVTKMAETAAEQAYRGRAAGGVYTDVSLEHLLRRLLECDAAGALLREAEADLKADLQALSNKFDEYSSALAANLKRSAQMWSILVGIALALVMNVDGLRLLQGYLQDPELRRSVIENLPSAPAGQAAADAEAYVDDLRTSLSGVSDLALPLGNSFFPHCRLPYFGVAERGSVDPLCAGSESAGGLAAFLTWLLKVVGTGMLIGLGAPFWYDLARRLAAIRTVFGGEPDGEAKHRGSDAKNPVERHQLIERVIEDAKARLARVAGS